MRILIADDDPIALDLLEMSLRRVGHEVVRATDGRQALDLVRADNIRVVITDWQMPNLERARPVPGHPQHGRRRVRVRRPAHRRRRELGRRGPLGRGRRPDAQAVQTRPRWPSASARPSGSSASRPATWPSSPWPSWPRAATPRAASTLERVRHYSRLLAQDLSGQPAFAAAAIDASYVRLIYLTSPLHDIGKVAIPDSVLLKPGKLSDREFGIMKLHTTFGGRDARRQPQGTPRGVVPGHGQGDRRDPPRAVRRQRLPQRHPGRHDPAVRDGSSPSPTCTTR